MAASSHAAMARPTGALLYGQRWTGAFTMEQSSRNASHRYGNWTFPMADTGMACTWRPAPRPMVAWALPAGHAASHTRSGHRHKHQWRRRTRPKRLAAGVGRVQRGCFRGIHALCHRRWDDGSGQRRQCTPFCCHPSSARSPGTAWTIPHWKRALTAFRRAKRFSLICASGSCRWRRAYTGLMGRRHPAVAA